MSTFSGTYNLDMSVLANYTLLMGDIFDQIIAMGWVQTADTGQTDPGGVGALPSVGSYTNYGVFRTNDGLTNVYLRVGFGRDTTTTPALQVQLGYSTDGAGAITGNKSTLTTVPSVGGSSKHVYLSGDTGRLMIATDPTSGGGIAIVIERSHDGSAADTSAFTTIALVGNGAGARQHTIMPSGVNGVEHTGIRAATPNPASGSWLLDTDTGIAFAVPMPRGYNVQPMIGLALHTSAVADFTADTTTTATTFGSSHTYLVLADTGNNGSNTRLMVRYE